MSDIYISDMHRTKTCILCGDDSEALTDEHVWSDWMTPAFAPKKRDRNFVMVSRTPSGERRQHPARSLDKKFKLLCPTCNNVRLGQNLENAAFKPIAKPMMLTGRPIRLTVENQLTLAVWAFKTLIVSNHAYHREPWFYSDSAAKDFIDTMIPPLQNYRVWMLKYHSTDGGMEGHIAPLDLHPTATTALGLKHIRQYTLTFVAGYFAFQAHAISGEDRDLTPLFPAPATWDDHTVQVWPSPDRDLRWPPPRKFRSSQYDSFTTRFGGTPPPE